MQRESLLKPRSGFYLSEDQVGTARENISHWQWASDAWIKLKREGDAALALPDEEIRDIAFSMIGQTFAYGISGCPSCGKPYPREDEAYHRMFTPIRSWRDKSVTCPGCDETLPNDRYPDTGQGFERNRQGYYPVGMWNFRTAGELLGGPRNHEGLATRLVTLYAITGEACYAEKAMAILDAFSAVFRGTMGPRDFTPFGSGVEIGRMHLLTSIVHRVKIWLASDYDWLSALPGMDRPSIALQRLGISGTVRENLEHMLDDYVLAEAGGPEYNLEGGELTALHNHEADGVRAMLAVGLAVGNPDYIRWGLSACDAFLNNAIGRDGMYVEGSFGYSLFTVTIFLDMAYMAARTMEGVGSDGREKPNPFGSMRFYRFAVEHPLELLCQGHLPSYGDWTPDKADSGRIDPGLLLQIYRAAVLFRQYSGHADIRHEAHSTAVRLYPLIKERLGSHSLDLFVRHPEEADEGGLVCGVQSVVMGGAGIAVLRDVNDTTLCVRVGANRTHAHDDVLAYALYSHGRAVTADLGYGVYGTNGHYGWMSKAAAHQTVVVNEDEMLEQGQIYKLFEGGSFTCLYESPELSAAEGDASALYGIGLYRRMLALVPFGRGPGMSYVADFFAVEGAQTTDYIYRAFHTPSLLHLADTVPVEGSGGPWTLAGLDRSERPYFDAPGSSMGERLTTGETLSPLLGEEQKLLWTPEPNNGYGYIYGLTPHHRLEPEPDQAQTAGTGVLRAVWQSEDGMSLTWKGCLDPDDRLYTGLCPSLDGSVRHPVLIVRDRSESKLYAAFVQVQEKGDMAADLSVKAMPLGAGYPSQAKAASVCLPDGSTDYWIYSTKTDRYSLHTPHGEWNIEGRCAWLRIDASGCVSAYAAVAADAMSFRGAELPSIVEAHAVCSITGVDYDADAFIVSQPPERKDTAARGGPRYIRYRRKAGDSGSIYAVSGWEQSEDGWRIRLKDSLTLSVGTVRSVDAGMQGHSAVIIDTACPLPLGISHLHERLGPTVFTGCLMIGEHGGAARITRLTSLKNIEVEIDRPFVLGERFRIVEVEAGGLVETVRMEGVDSRNA